MYQNFRFIDIWGIENGANYFAVLVKNPNIIDFFKIDDQNREKMLFRFSLEETGKDPDDIVNIAFAPDMEQFIISFESNHQIQHIYLKRENARLRNNFQVLGLEKTQKRTLEAFWNYYVELKALQI